jgi:hypothetical protein
VCPPRDQRRPRERFAARTDSIRAQIILCRRALRPSRAVWPQVEIVFMTLIPPVRPFWLGGAHQCEEPVVGELLGALACLERSQPSGADSSPGSEFLHTQPSLEPVAAHVLAARHGATNTYGHVL